MSSKLRGSCCSRLIIVGLLRVWMCFPPLGLGLASVPPDYSGRAVVKRLLGDWLCSPLYIGCKLLPLLLLAVGWLWLYLLRLLGCWCSVLSGAAAVGCCGWCCCLEFGRAVVLSGAALAVWLFCCCLQGCAVGVLWDAFRGCGCVVLSGAAVVLLAVRWLLLLVGCNTIAVYVRGLLSWWVWCCAAYLLPLVAWAVVLSGAVAVATFAVLSGAVLVSCD